MRKFYFEKLDVWQNSREFVKQIYEITNSFPEEERYGLTSQIRRASLSVSANISEGSSRDSNKDKARFINMSFSSAIEVLNFLILSNDLGFIERDKFQELRLELEKITNPLNLFYNTLTK